MLTTNARLPARTPPLYAALSMCLVCLSLVTLAGCGQSGGVTTPSFDQTTPDKLSVDLTIDHGAFATGANELFTSLKFTYQGSDVKFGHGETVACDDTPLQFSSGDDSYEGIGAFPLQGRDIVCVYTHGSDMTTLRQPFYPPPVFVSPKDGDTVSNGPSGEFTVSWVPGAAPQMEIDMARPTGAFAVGHTTDADGSFTFDNSKQTPGKTGISLARTALSPTSPDSSSGFSDVSLSYHVATTISVTFT